MGERPEDLNLPSAVITWVIKEALPDGVNISKEAQSEISPSASVFVLYATSYLSNYKEREEKNAEYWRHCLSHEGNRVRVFCGPFKRIIGNLQLTAKEKEISEKKQRQQGRL